MTIQAATYGQLREIYLSINNGSNETNFQRIFSLPTEIANGIIGHAGGGLPGKDAEFHFGVNHALANASYLQKAIGQVTNEIFNLLGANQKQSILSLEQGPRGVIDPIVGRLEALEALASLKDLLSNPSNSNALIEIIKVKKNLCRSIPSLIGELGIDPLQHQDIIIRIAKLCAQQDGLRTAKHIQNFGITDREALIEIAKLCAQQDGLKTAKHIQNFGITDREALIEIAKLCAQQDGEMAKYIQKFGIKNQKALIEIAKISAQQNGMVARYIEKFGIKNQEALIEIARLCAQYDGILACWIQNFGIKNQEALIEMAKFCAQCGQLIAYNIHNFGITDQEALIEIIKLCAQYGNDIGSHIQNFGIRDPKALIQIAKFYIQHGRDISSNIQNFGITDQKALIEIVKLCAQQGGEIGVHIENIGITDQEALVEIAKICVHQGTLDVEDMQNFGIKNQEALIEIAKVYAQHKPNALALNIRKFGITNRSIMSQICALCIINLPDLLRKCKFCPIELNSFAQTLKNESLLFDNWQESALSHLTKFIDKNLNTKIIISNQEISFQDYLQPLKAITDRHAFKEASMWTASALFFVSAALPKEQQEEVLKTGLIGFLQYLHSPILRRELTQLFAEFSLSKENTDLYLKQSPVNQSKQRRLVDLLLCSLQALGISQEVTSEFKKSYVPIFDKAQIQPLLGMLYLLRVSTALSPHEKQQLLHLLCDGIGKEPNEKSKDYKDRITKLRPELRNRLFALYTILLFKEEAKLKNSNSITACGKTVLQELLSLDGDGVAFEKFQQLFMSERAPNAFMIYVAKLSSVKEPSLIADIGRYVNSVMDGTFQKERYTSASNSHLKMIENLNPSLLKEWSSSLPSQSISFSFETQEQFDAKKWLHTKLLTDRHMEPNTTPHLKKLIEGQEIDKSNLSEIENALQHLLKASNKEEQIMALNAIRFELAKLTPCEFRNDIDGQLQAAKKNPSASADELNVVDSDDYLDLLLCGTEVIGSCQNVNASPLTNKGLLGYILDGKNRIIVIKDKRGHIIARAKLSLLWDGKQPVLFLERLYTGGHHEIQCRDAITKMALAKAEALKIPLATLKESDYSTLKQDWKNDLQSLSSGVSYEYSDAANGLIKNGEYSIEKDQIAILSLGKSATSFHDASD